MLCITVRAWRGNDVICGGSVTKAQNRRSKNIWRYREGQRVSGDECCLTCMMGRSSTASERAEIFHRATKEPSNFLSKQLRHSGVTEGHKLRVGTLGTLRYKTKMLLRYVTSSDEAGRGLRPYGIAGLLHGWEESTFKALPRLLEQRGDFLWMKHV